MSIQRYLDQALYHIDCCAPDTDRDDLYDSILEVRESIEDAFNELEYREDKKLEEQLTTRAMLTALREIYDRTDPALGLPNSQALLHKLAGVALGKL